MAIEVTGDVFNAPAAVDLTTKQFHLIIVDTNGKAALAGAGLRVDGILQDTPNTDEVASVKFQSGSKVVAGASIGAGVEFAANAASRAVAAATTNFVSGFTLEAATADGQIISVILRSSSQKP